MDAGTRDSSPGLVAKKKSLIAFLRDEWARAAFRLRIAEVAAADFVVIDEIGLNVDLDYSTDYLNPAANRGIPGVAV